MPHPTLRIKVCGLTSVAQALASATAGADWVGLNFHPGSPRRVDPALAAEIVAALPRTTEAVGLFVDRPPDEVAALADRIGLGIVQLHGQEPPEDLGRLGHLRLVRAFRIGSADAVAAMVAYLRRAEDLGRGPDEVLVDAYVPGCDGGTGQAIADHLFPLLPPLPRLILAGGLTPENVAERVARVRPWMVDVASGVESAPGQKDPDRVVAFIQAARSAVSTAP
ncbi:phosphoribosylanthranilate isomerase [Singulisphaera acidiphila]|uniref:N-(5'-phosphoribosyl)anthranilate isomerase n=1 Tax=Singulisphaera acidiphila (strain ATCC BAA-1392 / DSM 18658 / VKM B-2454 / MOB10) TaxID=886293 RepID=L0DBC9_SINAD|nr:phosphoribosylanthranilate isomerase [Singulisphaera acidiphila]AGA25946.1 phosphoribosylanthranilate isomerase [Singulisphaera acidiphila DSM 18658]